jgi:hypothetical protein
MPSLYIDKLFNELRDPLLSAMHAAIKAELRNGRVDVPRLFRSFTRAAAKEMSNPVTVSDKCFEQNTSKSNKGAKPRNDD